ncbi:MAG: hypothetical protein WDZ26_00370 [Nitriliruptoraceae bacterium]
MDQGTGAGDQPSEEEVRAYMEQLRSSPVDQVLAEICSALLSAAQVKLGRPDGRLLIDVVGGVADQMRGGDLEELTTQVDQALSQLRLAQVEAERQQEAGGSAEAASTEAPGGPAPQAPPSAPSPPSDSSDPSGGRRLWTPGS